MNICITSLYGKTSKYIYIHYIHRTKQNYMVWRIVKNRVNNLDADFQNRILEYNKVTVGMIVDKRTFQRRFFK